MIEVRSESAIKETSTLELLQLCCRALDEKKAENLRALYLGPRSSVADYFVIASGTSAPHLRALRNVLEKTLDAQGATILGMDTEFGSGWAVVDAGNIIFHLFTPKMRGIYSLEKLWKDADDVAIEL
ncbi:MAG: ribosome silencing factor [Opitutales bacterium]|jgi:ribosome-associated protein